MPTETPIVKPPPVAAAPAKSDAALGTDEALRAEFFGTPKPAVAEPVVKQPAEPSTDAPAVEPEPAPDQTEAGDPEGEPPATEPEQGEATIDETTTEPDPAAEPEPAAGSGANKRIRQLVAEKKTLAEKAAKLEALLEGGPQPPNAPPAGQPAPVQHVEQPAEYSPAEWSAYIRSLNRAREAGEQVPDEQIEGAKLELQKAVTRETLREESRRASQAAAARAARQSVIRECLALEEIDPRFALIDDKGVPVKTEFTAAVISEIQKSGRPATDEFLLSTANRVAMKVLKGQLTLKETQVTAATVKAQTTLRQTGLAAPQRTRLPAGKVALTPMQQYEALIAKGDPDSLHKAMQMEASGVLVRRR